MLPAKVPSRRIEGPLLGILGGMGPLASAEFVRTIYEENTGDDERSSPACVLYSDPSMPDRTGAILDHETSELAERLTRSLSRLRRLGATHVVVCCVTLHHCLPAVPYALRRRVISLLDVVVEEVTASAEPSLLLCTLGVRAASLFEHHLRWESIRDHVVMPNATDQRRIHDMIYGDLKRNRCDDSLLRLLDELRRTYGTRSFLAGCTEIHLLHKYVRRARSTAYPFVDPLWTVATTLSRRLEHRDRPAPDAAVRAAS